MPESINLTEADILEAMKKIPGYLDITPRDFKEIYTLAYREAIVRLSQEVFAAEIMTRDVVVVKEETPLAEVAAAMGARGITGVPVVDENGRVTGVISEKDFLARMSVTGNQNFMTLVATCLTAKGCVALPIKKTDGQRSHDFAGNHGSRECHSKGNCSTVDRSQGEPGTGGRCRRQIDRHRRARGSRSCFLQGRESMNGTYWRKTPGIAQSPLLVG